jgi:hypothetical protein
MNLMLAMEWGFKAMERGLNLEAARDEFTNLVLSPPNLKDRLVNEAPDARVHGDSFRPNTELYGRIIRIVMADQDGGEEEAIGVLKEITGPHTYLVEHGQEDDRFKGLVNWEVDSVNDLEVPEDRQQHLILWNAWH